MLALIPSYRQPWVVVVASGKAQLSRNSKFMGSVPADHFGLTIGFKYMRISGPNEADVKVNFRVEVQLKEKSRNRAQSAAPYAS